MKRKNCKFREQKVDVRTQSGARFKDYCIRFHMTCDDCYKRMHEERGDKDGVSDILGKEEENM